MDGNDHDHAPSGATRRGFVKLAALGAGAALYGTLRAVPVAASEPAAAAHATEALLLTCMDFRLMDDIVRYMDGRALTDKYDHIVLAGASLGAVTDRYPAWNKTFWDHLDVSIELHHITRVIALDHRDCGAYRLILGAEAVDDRDEENAAHARELGAFRRAVLAKHPTLTVETLLMSLDGTVEVVET